MDSLWYWIGIIVLLMLILINQNRAEKQRLYLIEQNDKLLDRLNPGWRTDMLAEKPALPQKPAGWVLALLGLIIVVGGILFVFLR